MNSLSIATIPSVLMIQEPIAKPKVFISYSWTSPGHRQIVKNWADRLLSDGVDVVLDIYALKEGNDKYAFMESMVTDPSVTHVLAICDRAYSEKADARKAGVGTESQIISKEVYDKVAQSKFIPIACELDDVGEPFLPRFFKSRIYIDFSSPEALNANWEQLIRLLYGKPLHQKPAPGKPPPYIREDGTRPSNPALGKFGDLKQALLHGKLGLDLYRQDFLDSCIQFADTLRVRKAPVETSFGEKVLADCTQLREIRNQIIDWVLLEGTTQPSEKFSDALVNFLERVLHLKARPTEVTTWNQDWFEAHGLFVYETFLYVVAALMKAGAFSTLREIFITHYLTPETERYSEGRFQKFDNFYATSTHLQKVLAPPGKTLTSPAAELIRRQADRDDLPFTSIIEAELVVLMMVLITPDTRWYPQTFHYAGYGRDFPFFVRATQHKHFKKLVTITGIDNAERLRAAIKEGCERLQVGKWHQFMFSSGFLNGMNLDKLDTIS